MPTRQERRRKYRQQLHHEPKEQVEAVESTEGKPDSECRLEKEAGSTARRTQAIKAAWRKASKVRYHANVAFRESKKARSKAEYEANPEAKKARSKARSKAEYEANPEAKKARSKARSKAEYEVNPEAQKARSKALSRKAYLDAVKRACKIVSSRRYYSSAKVSISQYRKAKYVLSEPKPSAQHLYVKSLKAKLLGDRNLAVKLREAFEKRYESTAHCMTRSGLKKAACRLAAKRILSQVLKKRKQSAGELLSVVRVINNVVITEDFGASCHTASSEPYFYDSAYTSPIRGSAIPLDEHGRCWIADVIERDDASGLPQKWKCTAECKLPTDDEVRSILKAKEFFKLPMAELCRELENVDSGCENGHYTAACYVGPDTAEDGPCSQLLGQPLACARGNWQFAENTEGCIHSLCSAAQISVVSVSCTTPPWYCP